MQLERIALTLRRRSPWEALDLGHAMWRAWGVPAWRAWAAFYWPAALSILLVLWRWPGVAMLLIWWLKPVFDRILLFCYSRALFGQKTTGADVRRALPQLWRAPGMFSGLIWRRLSMVRSFLLPVWQLEGQSGSAARKRFRVLARRMRGHAVWLTFFCANMVTVLYVALLALIEIMAPAGSAAVFSWSGWFSGELPAAQQFFSCLLWLLAESLIEPFYVAGGFALYLNRRSELEGWDIEIGFRRLAARRDGAAA